MCIYLERPLICFHLTSFLGNNTQTPWLLTVFSRTLDIDTTLQLWDQYILVRFPPLWFHPQIIGLSFCLGNKTKQPTRTRQLHNPMAFTPPLYNKMTDQNKNKKKHTHTQKKQEDDPLLHFFVVLAFLRRHEAALLACGEDTLPETISSLRFTGNVEVGRSFCCRILGAFGWIIGLRCPCIIWRIVSTLGQSLFTTGAIYYR